MNQGHPSHSSRLDSDGHVRVAIRTRTEEFVETLARGGQVTTPLDQTAVVKRLHALVTILLREHALEVVQVADGTLQVFLVAFGSTLRRRSREAMIFELKEREEFISHRDAGRRGPIEMSHAPPSLENNTTWASGSLNTHDKVAQTCWDRIVPFQGFPRDDRDGSGVEARSGFLLFQSWRVQLLEFVGFVELGRVGRGKRVR